MRSNNSCNRRSGLTCGKGGSTSRGGDTVRGGDTGKGGHDISKGQRRRPHSRPEAVPTACLGHARMFEEGREWRGWEDFFSLGKEMK